MRTNTYTVINGDRAVIVDPGAKAQSLYDGVLQRGARLDAILLTHAHFDHIGAISELVGLAQKDGMSPAIFLHKAEIGYIDSEKNLGAYMHRSVEPFVPDILLSGGEKLTVAGIETEVLHTPGHSPGGVCYKMGETLFSGDTLFRMTFGRTDLYDGSFSALKNSIINKLFNIKGDMRVLPGHGDETTLDFERRNNPIIFEKG